MFKGKYVYVIVLLLVLVLSACTKTNQEPSSNQNNNGGKETTGQNSNGNTNQDDNKGNKESGNNDISQSQSGNLTFENVWIRAAKEGESTEIYLTIRNDGTEEDSLHDVLVNSVLPLFESGEFYNGTVSDTNHLISITIPAGETVELKQGANFIYLPEIEKDLNPGDKVDVDLHFLNAGDVYVTAEVR